MPNLWGESDEEVDVILAQCNDGAHAGATIHCGSIDDEVIMSSHPDIKEHTPSDLRNSNLQMTLESQT